VLVGVLAAVSAVIGAFLVQSGPRPDATLHPSGATADDELIATLAAEGAEGGFSPPPGYGSEMLIDLSSLRGFGTFQDFEVWSAVNAFESPCLIAFQRETLNVVARKCVPTSAELFIDSDWYVMPPGENVRLVLRGDTVTAFHLVAEGAG
jgi:hypothetical protein